MAATAPFWIGCAVWAHQGWRGNFYPSRALKQPLRLYGRRLTAVEGNSFFYVRPGMEQLERWAQMVPEGFRFCPKVPGRITHERGELRGSEADAQKFLDELVPLEGRLGPCILQMPPSYGADRARDLAGFLKAWPLDRQGLTVELRHRQWFTREGAELAELILRDHGVGRAVLDSRPIYAGSDDPQREATNKKPKVPAHYMDTGPQVVLRLIAHPRAEITETFLPEWAQRIGTYLKDGREVHAFLHCPNEDHSPGYALGLQAELERQGVPVPALPEQETWDSDGQLELF